MKQRTVDASRFKRTQRALSFRPSIIPHGSLQAQSSHKEPQSGPLTTREPGTRDYADGKSHLYYSNSNLKRGGTVLLHSPEHLQPVTGLVERAEETLKIMHRWGYSPTVDALAKNLLGGSVPPSDLVRAIGSQAQIELRDGFVSLLGHADLVQRSSERVESHRALNGDAWSVARAFTEDLASLCPFVRCVAVCGSLASGGYANSDDLDFDLFVKSGTKYVSYLLATLVGLRYSWRYRKRKLNRIHQVWTLPKLICVNVVWSEDEVKPFIRRDADVAFELLRCQPLFGAAYFDQVCQDNEWVASYFPQLYNSHRPDTVHPGPSLVGSFLQQLGFHRLPLRVFEIGSRGIVWSLYHLVQWTRRRDPEAVSRMAFLRDVKWPYEVLQD